MQARSTLVQRPRRAQAGSVARAPATRRRPWPWQATSSPYPWVTTSPAASLRGAVECWGSNSLVASSPYPVTVPGLESGATAISAGDLYACALTANGAVQCWGSDPFNGGASPVTVVPGLERGMVAVSVGSSADAPSASA